jgi:hypothetical protein
MSEIKVKVTRNGGRKYLTMYYECPLTGKRTQRSTKVTKRRDAEREAMRWETELRSGQYVAPSRMSWEQFRLRYEDEVMPLMADNTN